MLSYLILYPTLTRAQQASGVLSREGVKNGLIRAPRGLSGEGCIHALWLGPGTMPGALGLLEEAGLPAKRVFVTARDGRYEEVAL